MWIGVEEPARGVALKILEDCAAGEIGKILHDKMYVCRHQLPGWYEDPPLKRHRRDRLAHHRIMVWMFENRYIPRRMEVHMVERHRTLPLYLTQQLRLTAAVTLLTATENRSPKDL